MKPTITALFLLLNFYSWAFSDSIKTNLTLSGYVELYYAYDFANPSNHERPFFLYNHKRHNEVNLNLAYLKAAYNSDRVRGTIAFMAGTYAQYNLASEQGLLKNIFEANAGFRLSPKKQLWFDAGIFSSHIGFESAASKDCWTLTRSILAENSPYYETGAKLNYTSDNQKWFFSALVLNGWQRIQRIDGNNTPAFGTQITFSPSSKITLNSSTFAGNDKPDSSRQMRYFHNYYGIFSITSKWGITTGFDIGAEQAQKGSSQYHIWYSPVLITKYSFHEKLAAAARAEYYSDPKGVIVHVNTTNGFRIFGYSTNLDYSPVKNIVLRLEGKLYTSKDPLFPKGGSNLRQNYCMTSSLALAF